jgi:DNA-binding transcriptional LysR family regulator
LLNVKHLVVFRAVVKAGSISAAARVLHISQPAVTKTVRLLEAELGLSLFLRVNGRLVLTSEAEELMPEVERLFGNVAAVRHLADEIRDGYSGSLSVATVTTLSPTLVARAIERFRHHPRVPSTSGASRHVVDAIATHQVDVGIIDAASGAEMDARTCAA